MVTTTTSAAAADVGNLDLFWEAAPNANQNTSAGATLNVEEIASTNEASTPPRQYRKGWRKPQGMPKRPMSSYNLFFQLERERLVNEEEERVFTPEDIDRIAKIQKEKDLSCYKRKHRKSHGKISFSKLARVIADKWKSMDKASKSAFFERAALEKDEYKAAVEEWTKSTKNTPRSRALSPTFLTDPIDSPGGRYADQYQSANASPDHAFPSPMDRAHQGMWEAVEDDAVMNPTTRNTAAQDGWMEQGSHNCKPPMLYMEPGSVHGIRQVHSFPSPPRRQLQPRFNSEFFAHDHRFGLPNGPQPYVSPMMMMMTTPDQHMKYSPDSAMRNIYSHDFADQPYPICSPSPSQNIFTQSGYKRFPPHMKMNRSRSFPLEEKDFMASEMIQQQCMPLPFNGRAHSQPNLYSEYYPSEYGSTHELAGLPLDTLVEVSPGQYIDPKVFNVETGKPHHFLQRRSTFSGGYNMEDNMITQGPRYVSRRRASDVNGTNNFPPREIVTVCRTRQVSFPEMQDIGTESSMYGNSPSSDHLLGTYLGKHHFPSDDIQVYTNEDEEKAALDLISLSGNQSQHSTFTSKSTEDIRSPSYHHTDHHQLESFNDDQDAAESNIVRPPLNHIEDSSYKTNHWEV